MFGEMDGAFAAQFGAVDAQRPIDRNGYDGALNGGAVAMLRFSIFIFWAFLVKNVKGSWAAIDGGVWKVRRVY